MGEKEIVCMQYHEIRLQLEKLAASLGDSWEGRIEPMGATLTHKETKAKVKIIVTNCPDNKIKPNADEKQRLKLLGCEAIEVYVSPEDVVSRLEWINESDMQYLSERNSETRKLGLIGKKHLQLVYECEERQEKLYVSPKGRFIRCKNI